MARTDPQVNFRMPADLKSRLEDAAKQHGRSVTQEIIARLEASLRPAEESTDQKAAEQAQFLVDTLTAVANNLGIPLPKKKD